MSNFWGAVQDGKTSSLFFVDRNSISNRYETVRTTTAFFRTLKIHHRKRPNERIRQNRQEYL